MTSSSAVSVFKPPTSVVPSSAFMSFFQPPYPPYDPSDKNGLSYETVARRWPIIVTGVVDQIYRDNHDVHTRLQEVSDGDEKARLDVKLQEGKELIEKVGRLKYEMGRDHALNPIPDSSPDAEIYNTELKRLAAASSNTWFTCPWLYAECYLYRLIRSMLTATQHWTTYDPFFRQKSDVFKNSANSIFQIANVMKKIATEKAELEKSLDKLSVIFEDILQICLWGNATDLSLLTNISLEDIERLQSTGKDLAKQEYILRDDQAKVWQHLQTLQGGQIDFVLDNAGFELFTDLVFADFLVTYTPFASKVKFHPKLIPWFVSDVTPPDFTFSIDSLLDPAKFFTYEATPQQLDDLKSMVTRWKSYLDQGIFQLSVALDTPLGSEEHSARFWTTPWPYWDLALRDEGLWRELARSDLVIFKGDLNFRKLTGDIQWPAWTPFDTALGPLAGSFPLLSLRTNKADVVVGVEKEVAERLDSSLEKWRVDGRYALISYCAKS